MTLSIWSWILVLPIAESRVDECMAEANATIHHGTRMLQQTSMPNTKQQLEEVADPLSVAHHSAQKVIVNQSWLWSKVPQIQPIQEIVLSKVDLAKQRKKMRVAVFAQAAYLNMLPELQQCITNVGAAQANTGSTVDVYLSTPLAQQSELPHITEKVKQATPALGVLEVSITQNKGADIGQFLQQMQSAAGKEYDAILKIHTKGQDYILKPILRLLCGNSDSAQRIIASFAANPMLGLADADGYLAWKGPGSPFSQWAWQHKEQENDFRTWPLISPGKPMPPEDAWTAAVYSFWWSRGSSVTNNPVLLKAVPRILAHMKFGYTTGSRYLTEHALERLIGTLVRAGGAVVARLKP